MISSKSQHHHHHRQHYTNTFFATPPQALVPARRTRPPSPSLLQFTLTDELALAQKRIGGISKAKLTCMSAGTGTDTGTNALTTMTPHTAGPDAISTTAATASMSTSMSTSTHMHRANDGLLKADDYDNSDDNGSSNRNRRGRGSLLNDSEISVLDLGPSLGPGLLSPTGLDGGGPQHFRDAKDEDTYPAYRDRNRVEIMEGDKAEESGYGYGHGYVYGHGFGDGYGVGYGGDGPVLAPRDASPQAHAHGHGNQDTEIAVFSPLLAPLKTTGKARRGLD